MSTLRAKHFDVFQIQQGIYAAIANEGTGAMANTGFVDLGETVLVFDSFNTQQAAAELREVIASVTDKPVSHLINSHWHGDHIRGNQVFRDVSIVATERTKRIMQENHPARIARQRASQNELCDYIETLESQQNSAGDRDQRARLLEISLLKEIKCSLPTLELVLPNETFEATWHTEGTNRRVECHTLGGGHTVSDSFLYIPDARVCYIGDLVAVNNHMLIIDGNVGIKSIGWTHQTENI
ncbi:MBL fold metallo-hydrolase [Alicyclobacillus sp. ALC3]|uniref:MBL fold metallo-hydrolase n=1 Tax=Alicyclobacillus sp. ALC3 TaxID=2796143 RepID=UPI002379FF79|nr:MBL fold metallo-hydrolase [Alicyclobacillus sp. ALC3]WDL97044.1 MBL fold metallo-hydrolase [Alicyclobacillus sp. ALC3]